MFETLTESGRRFDTKRAMMGIGLAFTPAVRAAHGPKAT
jgi:hypothetical protein